MDTLVPAATASTGGEIIRWWGNNGKDPKFRPLLFRALHYGDPCRSSNFQAVADNWLPHIHHNVASCERRELDKNLKTNEVN